MKRGKLRNSEGGIRYFPSGLKGIGDCLMVVSQSLNPGSGNGQILTIHAQILTILQIIMGIRIGSNGGYGDGDCSSLARPESDQDHGRTAPVPVPSMTVHGMN